MDENLNPSSYAAQRELITRWLSRLFLCQAISAAVSALSAIPGFSTVMEWISRIIAVVGIVILFQLSPVHRRYRKAAVFLCIAVGGGLLSLLLQNSLLALAWTICALVSQYQEYSAHSDLVAEQDPKLSRRWHSLFNWQIFGGVIAAAVSVFTVLAGVLSGVGTDTIVSAALWLVTAVTLILQIVYLLCLHRTLTLYRT